MPWDPEASWSIKDNLEMWGRAGKVAAVGVGVGAITGAATGACVGAFVGGPGGVLAGAISGAVSGGISGLITSASKEYDDSLLSIAGRAAIDGVIAGVFEGASVGLAIKASNKLPNKLYSYTIKQIEEGNVYKVRTGRVYGTPISPDDGWTKGASNSLTRFLRTGKLRSFVDDVFVFEGESTVALFHRVPIHLTNFWKYSGCQYQTRIGISGFTLDNQFIRRGSGKIVLRITGNIESSAYFWTKSIFTVGIEHTFDALGLNLMTTGTYNVGKYMYYYINVNYL